MDNINKTVSLKDLNFKNMSITYTKPMSTIVSGSGNSTTSVSSNLNVSYKVKIK